MVRPLKKNFFLCLSSLVVEDDYQFLFSAKAMYPEFLNAEDLCMELGACAKKSLVALPTCDECTGSVAAIGELIKAEENVMDVIAFLQVKLDDTSKDKD